MSFLSRHLFLGIALCIIGFSRAQQEFVLKYCSSDGNYTNSSTYQTNLNISFSSLVANITYGFYYFSYGQAPDIVYSIALCRGDLNLQDCRSCVNDSTHRILQDCPYQKEAIGWYDNCTIRYANRPIFGQMEEQPMLDQPEPDDVNSPTEFNRTLQNLLDGLKNKTAAGSSIRKYETAIKYGRGFGAIYGLTQCTPDLTQSQCNDCLDKAIKRLPGCCDGKDGGRIVTPSCNLRYETYRFYEDATPLPSPPPHPPLPSPPEDKKSNTTLIVIIVVVACSAVVVLLVISIFFRRSKNPRQNLKNVDSIGDVDSLQFDFATIRAATDEFSDANKLGQGGFGAVYKGTLYNGQEIAVKRLSMQSRQGDLEFKNEVLLVAKLQHRNLVGLLGFCLEGNERLLVYEFVPNASLDHFLFDPDKRQQLDWERRYKIIGGIARGILYLHEDSRLRIIHRDLKVSNVLLDEEMNPKISDFGMARLCMLNQTQGNTNRIVGTYGYMAPEYAMHGNFSIKSDVFSFGVLVLEIVCGRRNNYFHQGQKADDLLSHAWRHWREGSWSNLIDPIVRHGSTNEIMRCIHIGLLCVQENVADRPTMASVVMMLNSYSLTLPMPSEPAFFVDSSSELDTSISQGQSSRVNDSVHAKNETSPLSTNDASITELYPR